MPARSSKGCLLLQLSLCKSYVFFYSILSVSLVVILSQFIWQYFGSWLFWANLLASFNRMIHLQGNGCSSCSTTLESALQHIEGTSKCVCEVHRTPVFIFCAKTFTHWTKKVRRNQNLQLQMMKSKIQYQRF